MRLSTNFVVTSCGTKFVGAAGYDEVPAEQSLLPVVPPKADLATLVAGYEQAFERWDKARRQPSPTPAYFALFECLAWASAIDALLGKPNQPELRGLRFARNRVHHQWLNALDLTQGMTFPMQFPLTFFEFRWRKLKTSSRDADAEAYRKLVGVPARDTMLKVRDFFAAECAKLNA